MFSLDPVVYSLNKAIDAFGQLSLIYSIPILLSIPVVTIGLAIYGINNLVRKEPKGWDKTVL